jgi:hypothetical protein
VNLARLVDNRTPMVARCVAMDDPDGREQLVTIAKVTWSVSPSGAVTLRSPPAPLRFVAELRDGPGTSLRYPDDRVQHRPGTDVVMIGTAHPPANQRVTVIDVVLRVGDGQAIRIDKTARVYGPRVWLRGLMGVAPGPPQPLGPTPLIYENSYGGRDDSDPARSLAEERNPVGTGVTRDSASLVGLAVPPVEDPHHPLSSRRPAPAGFGPIPSHWLPLLAHGGTYDEAWMRERAPVRPRDFDTRFDGCAPDDQHCDPPLRGDEGYEIHGVLSDRVWRFKLPLYRPAFTAKRRDEREERHLSTHLDTVVIDADEGVVELTWRASVPLPPVPQLLHWVRVASADPLPDDIERQLVAIGRADLGRSP